MSRIAAQIDINAATAQALRWKRNVEDKGGDSVKAPIPAAAKPENTGPFHSS